MFSPLFALAAATAKPLLAATTQPIATPAPLNLPSNLFGQPQSWGTEHPFILGLVQAFFIIAAIGLIGLMAAQTTKTEGLSGSIGGRMESAYHGRLGLEQQIGRLTNTFAGAFVILAITFFFITR
ncbi:MAG TPA: preprotein translocase subunit SecG [Candidatus Eremiobacteraceae bacterium]|nr:preprotein translocase subunit SecG [Candidatus Eremiobacteraceae bacterium]